MMKMGNDGYRGVDVAHFGQCSNKTEVREGNFSEVKVIKVSFVDYCYAVGFGQNGNTNLNINLVIFAF